jgi:hypothetical protein
MIPDLRNSTVNVIALFLRQGVQDFLALLFVHFHNPLAVMIPGQPNNSRDVRFFCSIAP